MNSYVVMHGSYSSPFENWFPWLRGQLASRGQECIVPTLPTPQGQSYDEWSTLVDYYRRVKSLDEHTIVIGHSSGAAFAAKYIAETRWKVAGFVAIAGFNNFFSGDDSFDSINRTMFLPDEDLMRVREYSACRHAFFGSDDPYLPMERLESFAEVIGAHKHRVSGGGHLNAESGYTEFAALLDVIDEMPECNT